MLQRHHRSTLFPYTTLFRSHEKDTNANAKAIKKIPKNPPLSALESALFAHELGSVISKAPINDMAKTTSKMKNKKLNSGSVDMLFNDSAPKIHVTSVPSTI